MFQIDSTTAPSTYDYVERAMGVVGDLMAEDKALIVAWSGGKDSSATLNLVLAAAAKCRAQGKPVPRIIVTHADPGIENPEVAMVARKDLRAMRSWARSRGLRLETKITRPNLNNTWAVRVIGGRDLPVFSGVGGNRKCTQDMKIKPQEGIVKEIVAELEAAGVLPVTVTGTRFAESAYRRGRMEGRGELADGVWISDKGEARLSPIADWDDVELWAYLHACARGEFDSYSDFSDLIRLYKAGSDPADVQVIDGVEVYACRFGCALCTVGKEKSMAWMVKNDPGRYGYMAGLLKLQKYMLATQHDLERRQWVNFRITDDGYAMIRPNTYSPSMLEELLRYCLTLDVEECARAVGRPRFQLVSPDELVAIDATWSLQGHLPAHHALRIYREVVLQGKTASIPTLAGAFEKTAVPPAKFVYVGTDWQDDFWRYSGLRDIATEATQEMCSGAMGLRTLSNGQEVMDVNLDTNFTVDPEAACMVLDFELDRLVDGMRGWRTSAFHYYSRMGIISLARGSHTAKIDHILRRTMWKERQGLLGLDWRMNPGRLKQLVDDAITKQELDALRGCAVPSEESPTPPVVSQKLRQGSLLSLVA